MHYDLSSAELDRYIERVRKLPKLTREEEHDVAVLAKAGDSRATKRLVEANLRYVVAIAIQYRRYGVSLGELIGEGNLGLMTAARKFDASRGTRFVTYAGYWIRAHVLEHVVRSVSMVGAGAGALRSKMYFKLRRERARAEMFSNDATERLEHLAERFDTTPERMAEMLARVERGDTSLDAETREGGRSMLDGLTSEEPAPDVAYQAAFEAQSLRDAVREALDGLDTRERYIVEQRILNVDDDEASLADLGRRLGVSRERARQLEARAKQKLETKLRARMTL